MPANLFQKVPLYKSSMWLAVVGILAACLGGLGATVMFTNQGNVTVLTLSRTVLQGDIIAASDLTMTEMAAPDQPYVLAADRSQVAGHRALRTLVAQTVLAPDSYGQVPLPEGTTQISLILGPSQVPNCPLPGGTHLLVVGLPATDQANDPPLVTTAEVVFPPVKQIDGTVVLNIAVGRHDLGRLAPYILDHRLSLATI